MRNGRSGRWLRWPAGVSTSARFVLCALAAAWGPTNLEAQSAPARAERLDWRTLPDLPIPEGVAGAFAGTHDGALLIAGGANFPAGMPWRGGTKVYHDRVFVWDGQGWHTSPLRMRHRVAYGVSISTAEGLLCIGGRDESRCFDEVFRLTWNPNSRRVHQEILPSLPRPLAFAGGGVIEAAEGSEAYTYLVGGQHEPEGSPGNTVYRLQTSGLPPSQQPRWETLPPLPGPRRGLPVLAGHKGVLWVFSGRDYGPLRGDASKPFACHRDVVRFDPETGSWNPPELLRVGDEARGRCVMAGSAIVDGDRILIFGGASGDLLERAQELDDPARTAFLDHHPGFSRDVLAFDPATGGCRVLGRLHPPHLLPVATTAVRMGDRIVLPSGEIRPGRRSPRVWSVGIGSPAPPPAFGLANWLALGTYLLLMVGIGWWCSRRITGTEEFFLGGRRIPWWAAGMSIYGTQLSAITFMAIPATSFAGDWVRAIGSLMILVAIPVVVWFYLPKFRRLDLSTAYQFLEHRFGPEARRLAASLFVLLQLGRMGIVLYLPSIALATVTGLDVFLCIALMGLLAVAYTVLGGIEAVIWTDVVQVLVLIGGAILALGIAVSGAGGWEAVLTTSTAADKFRMVHSGQGLDSLSLPVMVIGFLFLHLVPYSSDQTVIQRYMTTRTEALAARSLWTNFWMTGPTALLFFALGTALFAFYSAHPDLPTPSQTDEIVPWFVVRELPPGVAGLVVAAIFAASMSSLDSSMNSVSTVAVWDFYRPSHLEADDADLLRLGRKLTLWTGLVGTGAALWMASLDVWFLFDFFNLILGLFGGALGGLFCLGVFTRRVSTRSALAGTWCGAAVSGGLALANAIAGRTLVHPFLFAAFGFTVCVAVGCALGSRGSTGTREPEEGR